jgi:PhzF family phenazine biosynthesis protein
MVAAAAPGDVTPSAETRRALLVDAFAAEPLAGAPVGVLPDAAGLSDAQMAAVAGELNAPETVFVRPGDGDVVRRFRYVAPTGEVDRCERATVAACTHLFDEDAVGVDADGGECVVGTAAGDVDVRATGDGTVWVTQPEPTVRRVEDAPEGGEASVRERIADALDVPADRLLSDLPLAVGDAGAPFLLVPLDYLTTLRRADLGGSALADVCAAVDAVGVYAFTFDTLAADADVHGRAVVPAGRGEEAATGSASAAVAAYLRSSGAFGDVPEELVCEQGHVLGRPARVRVRLDPLRVGGTAVTALDGEVRIPDAGDGDDGIIEA